MLLQPGQKKTLCRNQDKHLHLNIPTTVTKDVTVACLIKVLCEPPKISNMESRTESADLKGLSQQTSKNTNRVLISNKWETAD